MAEIIDLGDVVVWSGNGKIRHKLEEVAQPRRYGRQPSAAFLESGKSVLTCNNSQLFQLWGTETGKRIRSFGGQLPEPTAVAFSQDGKLVATISEKGVSGAALAGAAIPEKVRIWNISTGELIREVPWGEESRMAHRLFLTFSADSQSAIVLDEVAKESLEMRQWRVTDGKLVKHWTREDRNVYANAVAVSPDGKFLTLGSEFGYIRSFEIESGKEATSTDVHTGAIQALVFAQNDKVLRTMAFDGTARNWDAADGRPLNKWRHDGTSPRLAPDGATALVSNVLDKSGHMLLTARDPDSGIVRREFKGIRSFEFSDHGRTIWAKHDEDERIAQWDLRTGNSLKSFANVPGTPIAVTGGGSLVVLRDEERIIGFNADAGKKTFEWSLIEKKLLRSDGSKPIDEIRAWAVSPDGRQFAIWVSLRLFRGPGDRNTIYLCELATGKVIWRNSEYDYVGQRLVFRPDGKAIAMCGEWIAALLDVATGKKLIELNGHRCSTTALAFSADGKHLACGAIDGTALVWDVSDIKP